MKKFTSTFIAVTFAISSSHAFANLSTSAGYTHFTDISVRLLHISIAKEYTSDNFTFSPEFKIALGIKDTDLNESAGFVGENSIFEIDNVLSGSVRVQYNFTDSVGIFVHPSYNRVKASASGSGISVSDNDTEFNVGYGLQYKFTDTLSIEAWYDEIYRFDVVSVALRYKF